MLAVVRRRITAILAVALAATIAHADALPVPAADSARAAPPAIPVRYLTNEGSSLAYLRAGEGDAVVFLPDASETLESWRPQVTAFASHFQALSYIRRPVFGKRPAVHVPKPRDVRDFATLLSALGMGPVHLVGEGDGARLALHFAIARPELVRSLTLASPDGSWFLKPSDVDAARRALSNNAEIDTLLACSRTFDLKVPVMVIRRTGGDAAGDLRCIRNAHQVRVTAASTRLHVDNPEEFNVAVSKFLERLPISAGTP